MGQFHLAGRANRPSQRSLWRSVMRFLLPQPAFLLRLWWAANPSTAPRAFPAYWLGVLFRSSRGRRPGPLRFNFRHVKSEVDWLLGSWDSERLTGMREQGAIRY